MSILTILFTVLAIVIIGYLIFINSAPALPKNIDTLISQVQSAPIPEFTEGKTGTATNGSISIGYESIGNQATNKGTILLVNGHTQTLLDWPKYFYQHFIDAGYHVIRYDNRGIGTSDWIKDWNKKNPYLLKDMAKDGLAILDKLGIEKAHIIGMSMGGMIGQRLAISHPERVHSLTSIMSTGFYFDPKLVNVPRPFYRKLVAYTLKYISGLKKENIKMKYHYAIQQLLIGKGGYQLNTKYILQKALYDLRKRKGFNMKATDQHSLAIKASGSRYEELGKITAPTLVIHGKDDPLIEFPHAPKYASMIPNASTLFVAGMGHDIPEVHTPELVTNILKNIEKGATISA